MKVRESHEKYNSIVAINLLSSVTEKDIEALLLKYAPQKIVLKTLKNALIGEQPEL